MSTIHTITQSNYPPTVHSLLQQPVAEESIFQSALTDLTKILIKFEHSDDLLSQRIFKWGTKVLANSQNIEVGTDAIEKAKERIDKLLNKILINPLDGSPLKHPILERQWLWENWMLEDYRKLAPNSPFDGQPISSIKPHTFAEEMLTWVQTLPSNFNAPVLSTDLLPSQENGALISTTENPRYLNSSLMQVSNDPQSAMLKLFTYCQLAQTAVSTQALRENLRKKTKSASAVAVQVWKECRELIRLETERAEQNATAHQQMIEVRIECIEQTHHTTVDLLHTQIEATNQQLQSINAQLQNTQNRCTNQEQQIQRLQQLYAEKCQQVKAMGKSKKSKCSMM